MKTSQKGIDLIKKYEGFRSDPYLCPSGVATIGYGATYYPDSRKKVTLHDDAITELQAEDMLREQLGSYEYAVNRYTQQANHFTAGGLKQHQFDALVSFAYNLGEGALKRSTLLKKVNANPNDPSIAYEFSRWIRANGKILKGLKRRRKEEAKLYFT